MTAAVAGTERILDWEGCLNARDTGGLPTRDWRTIRRGALVRSDVLSRITPSGRKALIEHGVRTIVDVRSGDEVARDWEQYPFRSGSAAGDVRYLNIPFGDAQDGIGADELRQRYHAAQSREELNRIDLDEHQRGIAAIVNAIAEAGPGGVLVHCQAGKDRTGLIVALLLSLAGVEDAHIADDYALTSLNLEPLIIDWLDQMSDDETERARLRRLADPRREAMLDTLAYLRATYGTAEQYLAGAGVTNSNMERLRARLLGEKDPADG